jgi:hypothetical protein
VIGAVSTGDLLSAESLILAVVSGLLALWYSEIQAALHLQKQLRVEDRKPEIDTMSAILWRRAIPLSCLAALAALIFAPNSIDLIRRLGSLRQGDVPTYDPLAVSVVAVNIGMTLVALYAVGLAVALAARRRSFRRQYNDRSTA